MLFYLAWFGIPSTVYTRNFKSKFIPILYSGAVEVKNIFKFYYLDTNSNF